VPIRINSETMPLWARTKFPFCFGLSFQSFRLQANNNTNYNNKIKRYWMEDHLHIINMYIGIIIS